jgi:hypothetical protein
MTGRLTYELVAHVLGDLVEGHVTRALVHHLVYYRGKDGREYVSECVCVYVNECVCRFIYFVYGII